MGTTVRVIGGGLAGVEAASQLASHGVPVQLFEMRPSKMTPAHETGYLAELVCSNSLKSDAESDASGVLKSEMKMLGSLTLEAAYANRVPAGGALAVDRRGFSKFITQRIEENPLIEVVREEVTDLDPDSDPITVIATGPLTSEPLHESLERLTGQGSLYFFDAAAPIVSAESLSMDKLFWASRYGKGDPDYLNAPMTQPQYERFWQALVSAERHPLKGFEKEIFFEGCMPVEQMAARGKETLAFGPLKPVGLTPPGWDEKPYAVVQLRVDNRERTMFNLVGFQTNLKWGEQDRVFRMIPGLENAEFVRHGVMHRNTFINSPEVLEPTGQLRKHRNFFVAGQLSGVEGYMESAASGILCGMNASRLAQGKEPIVLPEDTILGGLMAYITFREKKGFQPMNATFGLLPAANVRGSRRLRREAQAARALHSMRRFVSEMCGGRHGME